MAMTGAERTRRYRERARERGRSIDQLLPVPAAARPLVAKTISLAIVQAGQIKDHRDRERLVQFWRSLARSQGLDLGRDRLTMALERRLRARAEQELVY